MKSEEVLVTLQKTIHFSDEAVSKDAIERLLQQVHAVPGQFGLHKANYWVLTDTKNNKKLFKACLNNSQVVEAPMLIVFSASRHCPSSEQEAALDTQLENGAITINQAEALEEQMKMYFDVSPLGLGWIGKLIATPILRLFTAMPQLACVHKREYLVRQVMKQATLFWQLAKSKGYGAEFIDMYDEWRLKAECRIPWNHIVVSVIALGHIGEEGPIAPPTNIDDVIHWQKIT